MFCTNMGGSNLTRNKETATLRLVPRDLTHVTELQTGSFVRDKFAVCGKRNRRRAVLWQVDYAMSSWKGPSTLVTEQCRRHPVTEQPNKTVTMFCSGLVRRDVGICPLNQRDVRVRPEQVWTVRQTRTRTRNINAPVSTHKCNGFQIKM